MSKKKNYKFNLIDLEDKVLYSYKEWEKDKFDPTLRTNLFKCIRDLAFAILSVGNYSKYDIDFHKISYEYGLYLLERIIRPDIDGLKKPFKLESNIPGGRFPIQNYIDKNILSVIFTIKKDSEWKTVLEDLEFYLDGTQNEDVKKFFEEDHLVEKGMQNFFYAKKLLRSLRVFYSFEDIRRLLYLSLDLLYSKKNYIISDDAPAEVRDFSIVLICLAKRLITENNLNFTIDVKKADLQKILLSATRSTVMLATVANSNLFPKELLLSLDSDSLNRLVAVSGGKMVRVPTQKDLETLIGSIVCISKSVMEGEDPIENLNKAKYDYDLVFNSGTTITKTISKVIETFDIFKEDSNSKALINLLIMSIKSLDILSQKLVEKSDGLPIELVLKQYTELSSSFSRFTDSLVNIKKNMEQVNEKHGESSSST